MSKNWPSFDELKKLAERSPEKLEEFRMREVEAIISQAPERVRQRLRGLQFQVNCQIRLHKSPMGSCIAISKMMHDSLHKLNAALHGQAHSEHFPQAESSQGLPSNVVPFAG